MNTNEMSDREFALHSQREFFSNKMKAIRNHNVRLWDWEKKRGDDGEVYWTAACPSHPESRYWVQRTSDGRRFYISDAYGAAYGDFSNPLAAMLSVERMWIAES